MNNAVHIAKRGKTRSMFRKMSNADVYSSLESPSFALEAMHEFKRRMAKEKRRAASK